MNEIWKRYLETVYDVSNTGFVRNSVTGKILSPSKTREGYLRINLWHNGKVSSIAVHRMVAICFLENPDNKLIVNHIDGNTSNCRLENLEWTTQSENIIHAYATGLAAVGEDCTVAKLTEEQVLKIIETMKSGESVVQVAKTFGVSAAAVSHIWNGRTWKHLKRDKIDTKNYKGKLRASDIPVIRSMFKEGFTDADIANKYGTHRASIRNIRVGDNWKNY